MGFDRSFFFFFFSFNVAHSSLVLENESTTSMNTNTGFARSMTTSFVISLTNSSKYGSLVIFETKKMQLWLFEVKKLSLNSTVTLTSPKPIFNLMKCLNALLH